jgi:hypothetical protein
VDIVAWEGTLHVHVVSVITCRRVVFNDAMLTRGQEVMWLRPAHQQPPDEACRRAAKGRDLSSWSIRPTPAAASRSAQLSCVPVAAASDSANDQVTMFRLPTCVRSRTNLQLKA